MIVVQCVDLSLVCVCVCQYQGEWPDRGGGRDESGGCHTELRCLRPQEHIRSGQVRHTHILWSQISSRHKDSAPEMRSLEHGRRWKWCWCEIWFKTVFRRIFNFFLNCRHTYNLYVFTRWWGSLDYCEIIEPKVCQAAISPKNQTPSDTHWICRNVLWISDVHA